MSNVSVSAALEFVRTAELPTVPRGLEALEAVADFDFKKAKDQAMVVGSDIVSFVKGVTEERRRDIVNSALLAQLVANKKVSADVDVLKWYDTYFDALTKIGWVIQSKQFASHVEQSESFAAHEAILAVATILLGPSPAALAVVKATLDAVKSLDKDGPLITLFDRQSQHASSARFQVTLAEQEEGGQFLVTLMAFALKAQARVTQVLFAKFRSGEVKLKHASGSVTINTTVLAAIRPAVEQKLAGVADKFIKGLPDLD
jgi:hypothetical protein